MIPSFYIKSNAPEEEKMRKRQKMIKSMSAGNFEELFATSMDVGIVGSKNCENLIGSVEIPVGVVGPVQVESEIFPKNVIIPMATTEGALVASTNRGAKVVNESKTCKVLVKKIGMTRAPVFRCGNIMEVQEFENFLNSNFEKIKEITESTSSHLKLLSFNSWHRGKYVFIRFVFDTDKAMGMNMVTIALKHLWTEYLSKYKNVKLISLSGNVCADKKDSIVNRILGRGYSAQAEVFVHHEVVKDVLGVESKDFYETYVAKNLIGSNIAGSFSQNMHSANIIAAVFLATGQDVAHVVEGSQSSTIVDFDKENLYVSVSLPNLNIGVVGGGTWLPAQAQARSLIQQGEEISPEQLAGATAIAVLAGEISGLASLTDNSLADAHKRLGRQ